MPPANIVRKRERESARARAPVAIQVRIFAANSGCLDWYIAT